MKVELRPVTLKDLDDEYMSWYSNEDGHLDYFTGSGRAFDRETLMQDYQKGLETAQWFYYLIETAAGERVGTIKIGPIDLRNQTSDLVTLVGNREFLGKGVASKAIALGNEIAFHKLDIRRLQSGIFATNAAAVKAYTRAGWFVEATLRGYYFLKGEPVDRVCVACLNPRYFSNV